MVGTNKHFDGVLNECLENIFTGKETVEECLQRFPAHRAELEPLLRTALIVNKAIDVKPSTDFRARARYQLQNMMTKSRLPKRAPVFVPRWAIAVCSLLLVFVLGGGTVLAADSATPESPLYPVKLATENVRVSLTGSEETKAELYVSIAERRVTEMTTMVDKGNTQHLEASAQRLNTYYTKIAELPLGKGSEAGMLTTSQATSQATSPPDASITTAAPIRAVPTTVVPASPVPTVTISVPGLSAPVAATKAPEPTTAPAPEKSVYGSTANKNELAAGDTSAVRDNRTGNNNQDKLKNVLGYYGTTQPEKLRKLIDSKKVPESVKPALRRALWASEHSYKQALDNLRQ